MEHFIDNIQKTILTRRKFKGINAVSLITFELDRLLQANITTSEYLLNHRPNISPEFRETLENSIRVFKETRELYKRNYEKRTSNI